MVYVTIPAPTKFNGKFQRTRAKPIKTQARSERRKGKGKNGTFYFHSKDLDSLLICFQKGTRVALSVRNGSPRGKLICCRCIHLNIRTDTYCVVSPGNVYAWVMQIGLVRCLHCRRRTIMHISRHAAHIQTHRHRRHMWSTTVASLCQLSMMKCVPENIEGPIQVLALINNWLEFPSQILAI